MKLEVREVVKRARRRRRRTRSGPSAARVPGKFIRVREGDDGRVPPAATTRRTRCRTTSTCTRSPARAAAPPRRSPRPATRRSSRFKALNRGLLRLPLRHGAGRHAHRQRHVRADPRRAAGGPAEGRPRVLRDAGRLLHRRASNGEPGLQPFDMEKAIDEQPDLRACSTARWARSPATTRSRRRSARRCASSSATAARTWSRRFHVIGEIFDNVSHRGRHAREHERADDADPGRAARPSCEFKVEVPGTYILVDHSIFRAFNKGALGMLKVEGPEDKADLLGQGGRRGLPARGRRHPVGRRRQRRGRPRPRTRPSASSAASASSRRSARPATRPSGAGHPGRVPAAGEVGLPQRRQEARDRHRARAASPGPITVNGTEFNSIMPSLGLSDEDVANVLTYVYSQWGNAGHEVTPAEVAAVRARRRSEAGRTMTRYADGARRSRWRPLACALAARGVAAATGGGSHTRAAPPRPRHRGWRGSRRDRYRPLYRQPRARRAARPASAPRP